MIKAMSGLELANVSLTVLAFAYNFVPKDQPVDFEKFMQQANVLRDFVLGDDVGVAYDELRSGTQSDSVVLPFVSPE